MIRTPSTSLLFFFFFNDTATTEIYTLSLHDALPICGRGEFRLRGMDAHAQGDQPVRGPLELLHAQEGELRARHQEDRKSTRLNSSHSQISYAVFCLKKKKNRTCHHRSTRTTSL